MTAPGTTDPDTSVAAPLIARSRSRSWRWLAAAILIASLAWVFWSLASAWPTLLSKRSEISMAWLSVGVLIGAFASCILCLAFTRMTALFESSTLRLREMGHLYFTAQLLKHVPGRVWGIGYQWAIARDRLSLSTWVWANLFHMMLAIYFSLWFATVVIAAGHSIYVSFGIVVSGVVVYILMWNVVSILWSWKWVANLSARHPLFKFRFPDALSKVDGVEKVKLFAVLSVSWIAYFLSWYANGRAYGELGGWSGLQMGAYYVVAWFVGYITLITPSGLGVRELVFVWLAKDFGTDAVALMAIVGRLNSLVVDVLLGLMFAPFAPAKGVTDG